jgi:hypothetical protein
LSNFEQSLGIFLNFLNEIDSANFAAEVAEDPCERIVGQIDVRYYTIIS